MNKCCGFLPLVEVDPPSKSDAAYYSTRLHITCWVCGNRISTTAKEAIGKTTAKSEEEAKRFLLYAGVLWNDRRNELLKDAA